MQPRFPQLLRHNVQVAAYWLTSKTPIGPPTSANPTVVSLLYAGLVTGAWSGLVSLLILGIAALARVPFDAARTPDSSVTAIPWFMVFLVPLAVALVGAALSGLLLGRRHARRIVFWVGTLVAIASCAGPLIQPESVLWSTRIVLLLMHIVTWFLVVPQIARIVGDAEPGMSVERE